MNYDTLREDGTSMPKLSGLGSAIRGLWDRGIGLVNRMTDHKPMSNRGRRRSELRWGIAGVAVTLVAALIAMGVYWLSPGHYRVVAQFDEAGQMRVGNSVRVAGVPVGTVKSIELAGDHVDVEMAVRWGTYLGDQTRADVKMLTIVGGSFVDLTTAGDRPLGDEPIPAARTTVPYSLMQTFQTIQPKLAKIDANPLRTTMADFDEALTANPGALRTNIGVISSMLDNLQQRQDQFGSMLQLAADYAEQINANGDVITQMARNLSSFISEYAVFAPRLNVVLEHTGLLLQRLRGLALLYDDDIQPLIDQLDAIGRDFGPALQRYTPLIEQGRDLIKRLEGMVAPDGSIVIDQSNLVLSSDYCVPMVGVAC
ncbi:MCE family protein [Gordonia sp. Z-3]|jgi:phospholipid/cholesterol/gamma-HCH transport system substrate-binding protein|uniref:MCE family protein n=1 Tax=Gordonia sp. Z-3 TaxID=3115408 RepID=UPI002E2A9A82|nr:MCE family protein [Gordonia sp. Z-3]MED5799557.1 MCE family protein [Gordonia sp. Z-3]